MAHLTMLGRLQYFYPFYFYIFVMIFFCGGSKGVIYLFYSDTRVFPWFYCLYFYKLYAAEFLFFSGVCHSYFTDVFFHPLINHGCVINSPFGLACRRFGYSHLLINGGLGYEANQAAAASQHALGLDGGLITTWFIGLAAAGVFGAAFERIANVPRNYLVKAALYGAAATEGVVSLNNYLVMTQPQNNPFAQIQTGTFLDLVFSAPFISTGVATAYHYLKSKKSEKTSCSNSLSKASSDKRPTRNYKESYQA